MNQKLLSIIIGSTAVAIIFGAIILAQFKGARKSVVKDKFPIISSDLRDTSKISTLLQGLKKHGNLPVSVGTGDKGRNNPFERY